MSENAAETTAPTDPLTTEPPPLASQVAPAARRSFLEPLSIVLVSRLGLILFAYLGLALVQGPPVPTNALPGNLLLDGWARWDSLWFGRIAQNGYTNQPIDASGQVDVIDLPLFPLLCRWLGYLTGDVYVAGILVSNIAFVIACLVLHRLVEQHWGAEVARRTLVLLCVNPFSYTFTAMYTESLFLACTIGAFALAERRLWIPAALCAGAASATRVAGVVTGFAIVLFCLQHYRWRIAAIRWNLLALPLSFSGLAAYVAFLAIRFHEPLAFVHGQNAKGWADQNSFSLFLEMLQSWRTATFGNFASANVPLLLSIHVICIAIAAVLCVVAWWKLPLPYAAFATLATILSATRWADFGRHATEIFPLFVVAGILLHDRRLYHGVVYISVLLLALFTLMFTHSIWVA